MGIFPNVDLTKFQRANKSKKNFYSTVKGEIVATAGTREQIAREGSGGVVTTLFTVPQGKKFYLTSVNLSLHSQSGVGSPHFAVIDVLVAESGVAFPVARLSGNNALANVLETTGLAANFPTPVILKVGDLLRIVPTQCQAVGSFIGFLEDDSSLF